MPIVFVTSVLRPLGVFRGVGSWPVEYLPSRSIATECWCLWPGAPVARQCRAAQGLGRELRKNAAAAGMGGPLALRRVQRRIIDVFEQLRLQGVPAAQLRLRIENIRQIGRGVGDLDRRALAHRVTDLIREATRIEDLVASDDGGTFLILLAGVTPMAAELVGAKLRETVEEKPFRIGEIVVRVDTSLEVIHSDRAEVVPSPYAPLTPVKAGDEKDASGTAGTATAESVKAEEPLIS